MQKKTETRQDSEIAHKREWWNVAVFRKFVVSRSGATAIEYALIAGSISIVIIVGGALLSGNVTRIFNLIADTI